MEVHHHSHHPKKWKEYITEFLMLFLAVSMGFLAENVREERVIEHQTQNVILQLRDELMKDSSAIHQHAGNRIKATKPRYLLANVRTAELFMQKTLTITI